MFIALGISSYMLLDPAQWVEQMLQLTFMSNGFKVFIIALAMGGFVCAYGSERFVLPTLAKFVGRTKDRLFPKRRKKRKEYKLILESMQI